ncbi:MAG: endonuclease III [Gemmatimonadaceae bacterium]
MKKKFKAPKPTRTSKRMAKNKSEASKRVAAKAPQVGGRAKTTQPIRRPAAGATETYDALFAAYPTAHCALDHRSPFELVAATILSAQCTDVRVNMVTPALFARYPTPGALAVAKQEDVEELIKSAGFFRNKAKSLIGMAQALVERHGGEVPRTMEELTRLPGVGRKTANVVLGNAFGMNEGIVVDTHVTRLSNRLGWTTTEDAVKIEQELIPMFPRENWTMLSHLLIDHGRSICDARAPKCGACFLAARCPSRRIGD